MAEAKLCLSDGKGGPGCGAELKRASTPEAHLDHTHECSRRICASCGTTMSEHYPDCERPWLADAA
jgi:hypothetical protein